MRFVGDEVLAIFPYTDESSATVAARRAWQAAGDARCKISAHEHGSESLDFGLGLHADTVEYGNIGVPTRLEFSVIGPVANQVAMLEGLTKVQGHGTIVSEAFTRLLPLDWTCPGPQEMKGISGRPRVYCLE